MISPYLARLGMTSGQACTLSIGLVLGGVLLTVTVPPVWERRAQAAPPPAGAAAAATAPAPAGLLALPAPAAPGPVSVLPPPDAPLALAPLLIPPEDAPLADEPAPMGPPPDLAGPTTSSLSTAPLSVVESGFSTPDPRPVGVPEGGLPIGARAGSPAEASYVRLDGTGSALTLPVSDDDGASFGPDVPKVQACRITTVTWKAARPGPAIGYDAKDCAAGTAQPSGSYTFDLSRFADRTDRRGFALVADPGTPTTTFRLTLTPPRSTP